MYVEGSGGEGSARSVAVAGLLGRWVDMTSACVRACVRADTGFLQ